MTNTKESSVDEAIDPSEETQSIEVITPIIVDLGKQRPKRLKALKQGRGKLMDEVLDVLEEVHVNLGEEVEDKTLVPIILLYSKKKKKKSKRRYSLFRF